MDEKPVHYVPASKDKQLIYHTRNWPVPPIGPIMYPVQKGTLFGPLERHDYQTGKISPESQLRKLKHLEKVEKKKVDFQDEKDKTLYIGNLPWKVTSEDIEKHFSDCGTIENINIPRDNNGKARGFAFVNFYAKESVPLAQKKSGEYLNGRMIKAQMFEESRAWRSLETMNLKRGSANALRPKEEAV